MHDATHLPLLLPKVQPPRSMSKTVLRPRLAQYVQAIEDVPLTVVSAPSGFGKTTMGATWARTLKTRSALVSWLSLDKEDDELTRFLQYLSFAVTYAFPEQSVPAMEGSGLAQRVLKSDQLVTALINRITEEGSEFFLFLDDFHVIASAPIKETIQFLIRNAPSNFHLILLSRPHGVAGFPDYKPSATLRIHASELCFTKTETRELFSAYSRNDHQASMAHSLTGGWAAVLRIMAASNTDYDRSSIVEGSNVVSEEYLGNLLNAVLSGLQPDEASLIDMTCIVGRMCAPLLTALTGIAHPKDVIRTVEHTHNLLLRVSDDGYWFACHDLIRESVMKRLSKSNPALVTDVTNRASHWYAAQGYWAEAVTQALAIDNRDLAIKWIESCAMRLVYKGDLLTLLGWESRLRLTSMPAMSVKILSAIALVRILAADYTEEPGLLVLIELIDAQLRRASSATATKQHWHLQAIRAILACRNDHLDIALELALECLKQQAIHPALSETLRSVVAYAYLNFREWPAFYRFSILISKPSSDEYTFLPVIYQQMVLGLAEITQLHFSRAQRYLEDANQRSCKKLGATSLPGALSAGLLAFIHYEKLELHKAESLLSDILDLVAQSGYIDIICRTYTAAAHIAMLRQDNEYALGILEKWEKIVSISDGNRLQIICAYEKLCFFLGEKSLPQASVSLSHIRHLHALAKSESTRRPTELESYVGLAEGQYALATGRFPEARMHLETVHANAVQSQDTYVTVLSAVPLAVAESNLGRIENAVRIFAKAMTLAQAAELKASLLCQPTDISIFLALYKKHALQDVESLQHLAFIQELTNARKWKFDGVAVSLSPREISVLQLIAQDKSNKEISAVLKITTETVKTHIKSIFTKLNVSKRNAAVRRATSMNLL